MALGSLAQMTGDVERTHALFEEAVALARSQHSREPRALYMALYWLGVFHALTGSNDRALLASEEALALARRQGDVCFIGTSLALFGRALVGNGDLARAALVIHEGIRVS